ncbi:MAG: SHOCT domain-containing protein [Candidatus Methanoperedens sp.]|nr:SHOCT domain-containing protein [Candidatus Methanoperedens sp.]
MQFGMMDGYSYGVMGYGMLIFGFIFWLLILIGLVLLIKYLWEGGAKKEESALELLKKRYARGEISKEEFEERKKDLL